MSSWGCSADFLQNFLVSVIILHYFEGRLNKIQLICYLLFDGMRLMAVIIACRASQSKEFWRVHCIPYIHIWLSFVLNVKVKHSQDEVIVSLGTHPSSAFSWEGGTSWKSVGEDQVPSQSARVWSCKSFGEERRGLEKGFIFSSDQVTPHKLEIQVWSLMQTNCMPLSCTKKSVRFRTVRALWYTVRQNFNPALTHCFVELFRRSLQEELIGGLMFPPHRWPSTEHSSLYYCWDVDKKILL